MEPIHFGGDRSLFGIRTEPSGDLRQTAILVCPSWGAEYMRAYRSLYLLAEQLAQRGFDVLRFDYSCTGDSAGETRDATLKHWLDDITVAAQELRRHSGTRRICLLGVRLGALLAQRAVELGSAGSATLASWDPPASGEHWIRESRALDDALRERKNRYSPGPELMPSDPGELLGMPFPAGLSAEIAGLHTASAPAHALRFCSSDVTPPADVDAQPLPDAAHWEDPAWLTRPWTPVRSLAAIADRLAVCLP